MSYLASIGGEWTELTAEEIKKAYAEDRCMLVHSYGVNRTITSLEIDGEDRDTRGETYQMSEAVWTQRPDSVDKCLRAAYAGA